MIALVESTTSYPFPIVAIDGPAGAGKSTIARLLAKCLHFDLLNTGAIYRSLAFVALQKKISLVDISALTQLANSLSIRFDKKEDGQTGVFFEQLDISKELNTPSVSLASSQIAQYQEVRQALIPIQRQLASVAPCVVEGRDVGTVLLPKASVKFFITAKPEIRAQRRYNELITQGVKTDYATVFIEQQKRDSTDEKRTFSPLKPASDAIFIDTTYFELSQFIVLMEAICRNKISNVL